MSGIFKLVRLRVLAFAIFTLYAMRYFVIRPILAINDFSLQLGDFPFTLLVVSVCCLIAGAGVLDGSMDMGTGRRNAVALFSVLNGIAVCIAFYLSMTAGIWKITLLFVCVSGLLWFYSSVYKRYFLVGNVLMAGMAALIPLSVVLFEIPLLNVEYANVLIYTDTDFMYIFRWLGGFSCFLFLNVLLYGMNKDLYTQEEDRENGMQTLAVKLGEVTACRIIASLAAVGVEGIGLLYYTVFRGALPVLLYFSGLGVFYVLYMGLILSKIRRRKAELGIIRFLTVGGIAFSLLLNRFFSALF